MKYLILTLFLTFTSFLTVNAQSQKPTPEQKQTINPIVDYGFTQWSKSWSYDKYVSRSAKITSIEVDEDYGDIEVSGDFSYKRLMSIFSGTFIAKINKEGQLVNITYTDANGLKGSKSF